VSDIDGPDFICVGMPKAGTGWLFDQLQAHPDFWMPPVKELLYLRGGKPQIPLTGKRGGYGIKQIEEGEANGQEKRNRKPHMLPRDQKTDLAFIKVAELCNSEPRSLDRYASLFQFKGSKLSGDISPMYMQLDKDLVTAIGERFPKTRILAQVRDPVGRAWSRISMYPPHKFDHQILEDADKFREFLRTSTGIEGKSSPTKLAQHWQALAPNLPFRIFLLDDVAAEPENTRREILSYLGADPDKPSALPADYNRKRKSKTATKKQVMSDSTREILVDYFKDEIRACADMFGGRARGWVTRYGL
jgi:hypothetical protein